MPRQGINPLYSYSEVILGETRCAINTHTHTHTVHTRELRICLCTPCTHCGVATYIRYTLQWRTKVGGSKRIRYPRRPISYIKLWALNCSQFNCRVVVWSHTLTLQTCMARASPLAVLNCIGLIIDISTHHINKVMSAFTITLSLTGSLV